MRRPLLVPAVLGAGLLAAAVVPSTGAVERPWGDHCELAWCQPGPAAGLDPLTDGLEDAARRARLEEGRGCVPPERWPAGRIPAGMVLEVTGAVVLEEWTYPAPPGSVVLSLCRSSR